MNEEYHMHISTLELENCDPRDHCHLFSRRVWPVYINKKSVIVGAIYSSIHRDQSNIILRVGRKMYRSDKSTTTKEMTRRQKNRVTWIQDVNKKHIHYMVAPNDPCSWIMLKYNEKTKKCARVTFKPLTHDTWIAVRLDLHRNGDIYRSYRDGKCYKYIIVSSSKDRTGTKSKNDKFATKDKTTKTKKSVFDTSDSDSEQKAMSKSKTETVFVSRPKITFDPDLDTETESISIIKPKLTKSKSNPTFNHKPKNLNGKGYPKYEDMIVKAIYAMGRRKASSVPAIAKYIHANYHIPEDRLKIQLRQALKRGLRNYVIQRVKNSYKLTADTLKAFDKSKPTW